MGQRPRLADVAARAGVSTASVSLVLRGAPGPADQTRRRVLDAAAALGYRADRTASLLARRRRYLLGVMLDVRNPFHAELAEEIHVAADRSGYEVVLATLTRDRDEARAVETLMDFRCEALLLLGPDGPESGLSGYAAHAPVVVIGRRVRAPGVDVVRSADEAGVAAALNHLIGLGHRRIAFIDGGRGAVAAARRRGYRAAMRHAGLPPEVLAGDHTEAGGTRAGRRLLATGRGPAAPPGAGFPGAVLPSAVLASNDRCAVGLLDVCLRAGVAVPGEIAVAGYDDSTLARLAHIDLTSVNQDAAEQARHAVAAAVSRLDAGRTRRSEVVVEPRLVVRGSTAPASRKGHPR
ncbi:LacI family DNA-binding transcriptional regulator [Mangrovihabitans endophyticus]|uniref:LacI family transcriptional regulator n=1 Tax=Mangrovihabitans endophyticus TaxID=1751298 RepID=A0A8J3C6Z3_9ACTN|nr:LacI family DNA-binding transcriptional regulator [Mangrovihabitans endophyticus]GGL15724.1 LacI family transcriptional regulator [Mangrovihabitans endophyticus]